MHAGEDTMTRSCSIDRESMDICALRHIRACSCCLRSRRSSPGRSSTAGVTRSRAGCVRDAVVAYPTARRVPQDRLHHCRSRDAPTLRAPGGGDAQRGVAPAAPWAARCVARHPDQTGEAREDRPRQIDKALKHGPIHAARCRPTAGDGTRRRARHRAGAPTGLAAAETVPTTEGLRRRADRAPWPRRGSVAGCARQESPR